MNSIIIGPDSEDLRSGPHHSVSRQLLAVNEALQSSNRVESGVERDVGRPFRVGVATPSLQLAAPRLFWAPSPYIERCSPFM
jgi:hypothetical protein